MGIVRGIDKDSASTLQIEVAFKDQYFDGQVPSLWIKSQGAGDGTNKSRLNGNLWANNCQFPLDTVRTIQPYTSKYTAVDFPKMPDLAEVRSRLPSGNILGLDSASQPSIIKFPRPNDKPTLIRGNRKAYEYILQKVSLNSSQTIEVNSQVNGESVIIIFYVLGNIDSNLEISHKCGSTNCPDENFIILGYGPTNSQMCLKFDQLDGFIFAPNYQLGINQKTSTIKSNFNGSAWIDKLLTTGTCGSNFVIFNQTLEWKNLPLDFLVINPYPQIIGITAQKTLETLDPKLTPDTLSIDAPLMPNTLQHFYIDQELANPDAFIQNLNSP
jgi:hypothetical protein